MLSGTWLVLCFAFGSLPPSEACGAAVTAVAKRVVQAVFNGIATVAKSGIVSKVISYGAAGALAGTGDAAGDYISARVQGNTNIELAKMQQQYLKELQVAVPPKPTVTITDVTHDYSKAQINNDLHNISIQLMNSTIAKRSPPIPAPVSVPQEAISPVQTIIQHTEKVFVFYYIIEAVSVCTMLCLVPLLRQVCFFG